MARRPGKTIPKGAGGGRLRGDCDLFAAFMEHSPVVAWMKDAEGRYVYVNRPFEERFRRPAAEWIGRTDLDFWPPATAERLRGNDGAVLRAGRPAELRESVPMPDGREREWWVLKFPFRDAAGAAYVGGMAVDVTDHEQIRTDLRESEARAQAVLDTVVDGIITIDERGHISSFNAAAARIFGYAPDEVVGRNVSVLMPPPYRDEHDGYLGNYLRTGERKIIGIGREVEGRRKDGSTFPLDLAVSEVRLGGRRMFTGIVRDLTAVKRMQEELVRSRALSAVGEMAASVAHEIKNPLAGIGGAVQVLRDGIDAGDPRREILDEVLNQVRRLDRTVRDLLMFARPWTPQKAPCDLVDTARAVAAVAAREATFANIRFVFDGAPALVAPADRTLVEQVFWNLFLNAGQAMAGAGEIRCVAEADAATACLRIADTGPGIPADVLSRMFQPFFTTKAKGTGLGLAICRRIVEAHGGVIHVDSAPGRGTSVHVRLPLEGGTAGNRFLAGRG